MGTNDEHIGVADSRRYIHMTDLVDQMFPPVHRSVSPEYTDLVYWRMPVCQYALPDLTPPSPALSARSDTSRLGRLTSAISLLSGSRSRSPSSVESSRAASPERGIPLYVQALDDSLSKLANADEEYIARVWENRSVDSMPGSLSGSLRNQWGGPDFVAEEDERGDFADEEEYGEDSETQEEHSFDDDLLVTGLMETVPYL